MCLANTHRNEVPRDLKSVAGLLQASQFDHTGKFCDCGTAKSVVSSAWGADKSVCCALRIIEMQSVICKAGFAVLLSAAIVVPTTQAQADATV